MTFKSWTEGDEVESGLQVGFSLLFFLIWFDLIHHRSFFSTDWFYNFRLPVHLNHLQEEQKKTFSWKPTSHPLNRSHSTTSHTRLTPHHVQYARFEIDKELLYRWSWDHKQKRTRSLTWSSTHPSSASASQIISSIWCFSHSSISSFTSLKKTLEFALIFNLYQTCF